MNCQFNSVGENHYKCSHCGFEIKISQDPSKIFRACGGIVEPISVWQQVKNVTSAVVDYAKDGFTNVSEEERNKRLEICRGCEFFNKDGEICSKCTCHMKIKTYMRSSNCPIGKW